MSKGIQPAFTYLKLTMFKVNNKETRTTWFIPSIDNFKHKFPCWIRSVYFERCFDNFEQLIAQKNKCMLSLRPSIGASAA